MMKDSVSIRCFAVGVALVAAAPRAGEAAPNHVTVLADDSDSCRSTARTPSSRA